MTILESQNREEFVRYLNRTGNTICGRHPIQLFLTILEKASTVCRTKFIRYAQSSAVTSMNDSSVSYAAAVIEQV